MMLKTTLAVATGVAVAALSALPSEAATVNATTNSNTILPSAAYQIQGLQVGGSSFTVDFKYGTFTNLFSGVYPDYSSLVTPASQINGANAVSNAILSALNGPASFFVDGNVVSGPIGRVIDIANTSNVLSQFYVPIQIGQNGPGSNESLLSFCNSNGSSWTNCNTGTFGNNANHIYAKLTPENHLTAVPTPALLPGLIGMGIAAVRKRKQVAVEALDA